MRLVLATGNRGKVEEIGALMPEHEVVAYGELIAPFEIEENGATFAENAVIKARAVSEALGDAEAIVISDDSGISVPALGGEPGLFSARYAGAGASDEANLTKLIENLKARGLERTPAYYTAAIAVVGPFGTRTVHGWMHGEAITTPRGSGGFGYDPMFVPGGYTQSAAELPPEIKGAISHRGRALKLLETLLSVVLSTKSL
jgi:XTP/dITP diphosphohydrolase